MFKVAIRRGVAQHDQERIARAARVLVDPLLARIREITSEKDKLTNKLDERESDIRMLKSEVEQNNQRRIALKARIEELNEDKVKLVNDLSTAEFRANQVSTELDTSILVDLLKERIKELVAERFSLTNELSAAKSESVIVDSKNHQLRADFKNRIDSLKKRASSLKSEMKTLKRGRFFLITAEEHRHWLLQAIERSTSELTLVSPWIKRNAFDGEIRRMLVDAIGRGTKVRIAWGFDMNSRDYEAYHNMGEGNRALSDLKREMKQRTPKELWDNLVVKRTETHEKLIICDDQFCAWGSFNWLSYRGELGQEYRREISSLSEKQDHINKLKRNAAALFGSD